MYSDGSEASTCTVSFFLNATEPIEAQFHKTPPVSPALTPIESMFHIIKSSVEDAVARELSHYLSKNLKPEVFEQCIIPPPKTDLPYY